ncbi:MAG: DUF2141 domain-containing protein [Saprospiraceae bacterium]|nr:DUF2141 domain-containing protein [Saprospiraceae bacterium]
MINIWMILSAAWFFSGFSAPGPEYAGTLQVEVRNVDAGKGILRLALYRESGFLKENGSVASRMIRVTEGGRLLVEVPSLTYGPYALAAFHDLNENDKLDTNIFGIPVEPYAFSKNTDIKWRNPRFDEVKFDFTREGQQLSIALQRWQNL